MRRKILEEEDFIPWINAEMEKSQRKDRVNYS